MRKADGRVCPRVELWETNAPVVEFAEAFRFVPVYKDVPAAANDLWAEFTGDLDLPERLRFAKRVSLYTIYRWPITGPAD